eukprot:TRINITY_DN567_c0_g2_i1.p1 TRINITY_DN567_c0_g2~~TRINITY_DN567_c0_g2_i1.p1  ORF type:complete len:687 (-),score=199.09 TRINITY_DN567_c0_g2_i1:158-2218(-)
MSGTTPASPIISPRNLNSSWKASLPRGNGYVASSSPYSVPSTPAPFSPAPVAPTTPVIFSAAHASIQFNDPLFPSGNDEVLVESVSASDSPGPCPSSDPLPYVKPKYPLKIEKKKDRLFAEVGKDGQPIDPAPAEEEDDEREEGAEDRSEGAEVVWQLQTEKGKEYYRYRLGRRSETFDVNDLKPGWYVLRIATPDLCTVQKLPLLPLEWRKIPGIQVLRNLKVAVHVSSGRGQTLNPEDDVIYASRHQISTSNSIVEVFFQVKPEHLLSKFTLTMKTQAKFPFVAKARLCRYQGFDNAESAEAFQRCLMFRRLSRKSSYKKRAYESGMIRPFLLLVSMDTLTRHHVGRILGITLANSRISDGDSHAESYKLLFRRGIGLKSRTEVLFEKVTFDHINWYNCVHRACVKLIRFKVKERFDMKKDYAIKHTLQACRDPRDPLLEEIEVFFLEKLYEKLHANLPDEDKLILENLFESEYSTTIANVLKEQGFTSPDLHRLAVLLLQLQALKQQREENKLMKKQMKMEKKRLKKLEKMKNKEKKGEENSSKEEPDDDDDDDDDDDEEVMNEGDSISLIDENGQNVRKKKDDDDYRNKDEDNNAGLYNPYSKTEEAMYHTYNVAKIATLITAKFIIFAINPFLCIGLGAVFMFAEMNKSNHGLVFLVATQLLTRRLLLAAQGVSLDPFHTS